MSSTFWSLPEKPSPGPRSQTKMGHFSGTETYWDGYSAWPFFIPKEPHQSQQRTRKVAYFFTLKRTKTGRRNGLLPKPNWTTYIRSDTSPRSAGIKPAPVNAAIPGSLTDPPPVPSLGEPPLPDTHSGATRYSPHRYHFSLLNNKDRLLPSRG